MRLLVLFCIFGLVQSAMAQKWRSSLYPEDWYPGLTDDNGRYLHDFSFAGYHAGEKEIPFITENIIDITKEPYFADTSGVEDVTAIIQTAIDSAGLAGGGVVYLPKGLYRIVTNSTAGLWIKYSHVVLRGDGKDKTYLFNDQPSMRKKSIILVKPASGGDWYTSEGASEKINYDISNMDTVVYVSDVSKYSINDWIVVTSSVTEGFIADHKMTDLWNTTLPGMAFYRKVKGIDNSNSAVILDAPVRYDLKTRDNVRINKVNTHLEEVGIENLSIGNRQNDLPGWEDLDYKEESTGAYDVDNSIAVDFKFTVNSWMRNVSTFKPAVNTLDVHLTSHGVLLEKSRFITLDSCYFGFPQYEGENGNGYMYTLRGNDCLLKNSVGDNGRHNFDFKSMMTSGNVILRCTGKDSRYASDFHMHLSVANLFDNHNVDNDFLEAAYRPYGTIQYGQTTSQSVFWNTNGIKASGGGTVIIKTQQWGYGYVIGTRGNVTGVSAIGGRNTEPVDFVEGVAKGENLEPESLYENQLSKRMAGYQFPSKVHSTIENSSIDIYPSVVQNTLNISAKYLIQSIEVFDYCGNQILRVNNTNNQNYSLPIDSFLPGYYLVKVSFQQKTPVTGKFIKM